MSNISYVAHMQSDALGWARLGLGLGYLTRIKEVRLFKQLFYRELQCGKCPRHKCKKHFKDIIKKQP